MRRPVPWAAVALLASWPALAVQFASLGPDGASVTVVAVHPTNSSIVYAGTASGGVFKSTDAGTTWQPSQVGLRAASVLALAIDPTAPSTLYAGTIAFFGSFASGESGLYKSVDAGATWSRVSLPVGLSNPTVNAIAIKAGNPSIVYCVPEFQILRSADGGASWSPISAALAPASIGAIAVATSTPARVYAVIGWGVFKSADDGGDWAPCAPIAGFPFFRALAVAPDNPDRIFVASSAGIARSSDGCASWNAVTGLPPADGGAGAVVFDPGLPSRLLAGLEPGGVFQSTDGGANWTPSNGAAPELSQASIRTIAMAPSRTTDAYAGSSTNFGAAGSLWKTTDSAVTWQQAVHGLRGTGVHALLLDAAQPLNLICGSDAGVYRSSDGGQTWSATSLVASVNALAVDPSAPATLYAGVNENNGGLYRSNDDGQTWTKLGLNAPFGVASVAVDPTNPARILAGGIGGVHQSQGLSQSLDGGLTWKPAGFGFGDVRTILIDPSAPSTLYVTVSNYLIGTELAKTVDGGATFADIGPQAACSPSPVVMDPVDSKTLYVSCGPFPGAGVYRTSDGGATWSGPGTGLPEGPSALAVDPSGSAVYAWAAGAVYRSVDRTATWSVFGAMPSSSVVTTLVVGLAGGPVYAGTTGAGLFATPPAGSCSADPVSLCLNGGRFLVQVLFRASSEAPQGAGTSLGLTPNTGAFWFFSPDNLELVVKVLDGRAVNGKWWVFYGALSNVEYTITVTDTQTGAVKTYFNPQGQLASVGDTSAF